MSKLDLKMTDHQQQIVILGGGTAGWMSAAALAKLLPNSRFAVTLVESDQISTVGVGEATLPHLRFFNQRLGIDEREFMRETQATFKVGIEFSNWGKQGDAYIHPFGDYGNKINDIGFHHFWLKAKQNGDCQPIDVYSLPVMSCLNDKFDFPTADHRDIGSTFSYAYHINATRYAKYLRSFAEKLGVVRQEGKVIDVIKRARDNHIEMLVLENGQRIAGDFFVDCSGFRGQLIDKTLGSEFEDWSHWLPCNSGIAIASEGNQAPLTYTKAIAREAGWQWQIPLQTRMGNGYVFSDQFIDKQQALDTLIDNLPGKALTEPNYLSFKAGKRKQAWRNNCLAVGLSSGFLEPLESTSIYLIQRAIMKLVEVLPQPANLDIKAKEYNRSLDMEMERIRDFLILHYHATERTDTDFWQYCRTMDIPDSLRQKMLMFKQTGHIQHYKYGLFLEPSWLAVYIGQGIIPTAYDSRVDLLNGEQYRQTMEKIKTEVHSRCQQMPAHSEVIKQFCQRANLHHHGTATSSLYGNFHGYHQT